MEKATATIKATRYNDLFIINDIRINDSVPVNIKKRLPFAIANHFTCDKGYTIEIGNTGTGTNHFYQGVLTRDQYNDLVFDLKKHIETLNTIVVKHIELEII